VQARNAGTGAGVQSWTAGPGVQSHWQRAGSYEPESVSEAPCLCLSCLILCCFYFCVSVYSCVCLCFCVSVCHWHGLSADPPGAAQADPAAPRRYEVYTCVFLKRAPAHEKEWSLRIWRSLRFGCRRQLSGSSSIGIVFR
jgi:hypothetical protein